MCHALFVFVFILHYETYESCSGTICVFDALYVRLSHSGILCIRLGFLCLAICFGAVQGHEQAALGDLRQQGESQQADAERTLGSYIHKPGVITVAPTHLARSNFTVMPMGMARLRLAPRRKA